MIFNGKTSRVSEQNSPVIEIFINLLIFLKIYPVAKFEQPLNILFWNRCRFSKIDHVSNISFN